MTQAYILHHYPYGENSTLLKLLSLEQGLVSALAKGVKTRSHSRTLMRPFAPLLIELSGRGALATVRSAEPAGPTVALQGKALYSGLYLNELLLALLSPGESHAALFHYYQATLAHLEHDHIEPALRSFELALLRELGYMPHLQEDSEQCAISPEAWYRLRPDYLPERIAAESHTQTTADRWLGADLLCIAQHDWQLPSTLQAAKRLTRQWIHHYTQGRTLQSRALFKDTRRHPD